jgi:hypothetical protein
MKIYLDSCCLNRPYDDLSDETVRLESEAVLAIIDRCENGGEWEFWGSDVLLDEISSIPHPGRRQRVMLLYRSSVGCVGLTDAIVARAKELAKFNIKPYDALHLASAEAGGADIFLTTDRKLVKVAKRADVKIKVENPLVWLTEVLYER